MSAAATARPRPTPKAAEPQSFERRRDGFTRFRHQYMYDLMRITGPKVDLACVLFVLTETEGADRDAKAPAPEKSRALSSAEFAWFAGEADVRTVQYALKDLCQRKVLVREYAGRRGLYCYSAPVATWAKLPDYADRKPAQSAMELDSGEETENVQRKNFRSVRVSPNVPTKPMNLHTPPQRVQFECSGAASIQHGIEEGLLIVRVKVVELDKRKPRPNFLELASLSKAVSNDTNALPSSYDTHFHVAWAEAGLSGSDWDHEQAADFWKKLEIAEQMVAVSGLRKQALAGDFSDSAFHPLPQNYLLKKMYQRAPRGRPNSKTAETDARMQRILESL